ncbi:MAG: TIGR00730 family Rossman fold protein [Tistrella sp.]|nr:TIGR00730 family Rossman fold protein [Tistrella sp.]
MNRLCVFCGSNPGDTPAFTEAARQLGRELARRQLGLVYGGGRVGLMGQVADATMAAGGEGIGVIPKSLEDREVGHRNITDLRVVGSMHERKAMMADLADGFIALPGGIGTFEELFEVWTWAQLGSHAKPVGLLDVDGFYQPLLGFLHHVAQRGFMKPQHLDILLVDTDPARLIERFAAYRPKVEHKWIEIEER